MTELTLQHLVWWLQTRDPEESYDYCEAHDCLMARWTGCDTIIFAHASEIECDDQYVFSFNHPFYRVVMGNGDRETWTMGEALYRAQCQLRKQEAEANDKLGYDMSVEYGE